MSCGPGQTLSEAQQRVGILEVVHEMSEGAEKLAELFRLKESLSMLSVNEYLFPFRRFLVYQHYLTQLLLQTPLQSVKQSAFLSGALETELGTLFDTLLGIQEVIHSPSEFARRHALAKYRGFLITRAMHALATYLEEQCNVLDFDFVAFKTRTAVLDYKRTLGECRTTYDHASQLFVLVNLRKQVRSYGPQQNIYNALHHHFKKFRLKQQQAIHSSI
jgi:hypothetical protein